MLALAVAFACPNYPWPLWQCHLFSSPAFGVGMLALIFDVMLIHAW